MKLKYSVNFRLEKRRDKSAGEVIILNVPINLDFTYEGKRLIFYTGYRINTNQWIDFTADSTGGRTIVQRVKKNIVNTDGVQYNHINNRLDLIKSSIEKIYIQARANNLQVKLSSLHFKLTNIKKALMMYNKEIELHDEKFKKVTLKDYFRNPNNFDLIMKLPQMRQYFHSNLTPKEYKESGISIVGSFIYFLRDSGYFKQSKLEMQTLDMQEIARNCFMTGSSATRAESRNVELFSFILNEVTP